MNCLTKKFIVGEFKYDSDGLTYPIVYIQPILAKKVTQNINFAKQPGLSDSSPVLD